LRRLLYIAFFIEGGLLLVVLPWSEFWDRNYFGLTSPIIHAVIANDFVRGAISGLGLLNLAAGLAEILPPPSPPK
jgi:hypothetical protein